jgi:hypothetical protein
MKNFFSLVLLVMVLLNLPTVLNVAVAQDSLKTNMKSEAGFYLNSGNYAQALNHYRELLNTFPKEPEYQYGLGICLIHTNGDLEEAVRILRPVAVAEYNPQALFYLGRAYHLVYSFEDAIKAYSKFMIKGKRSDIKGFQVERLIEMARNGQEFTRSGHPVNVLNVQSIPSDELRQASAINGSGKLMPKPVEFCNKTDVINGYRPWMFLPSYTEVNEYVYVAGYEPGKKNNKQLFRIKNINHQTWGLPELLNEIINTKYDEEFPFFDVKTSTLYFSSNGHSSMGGYDIFRSVYDWNSKTWTRPENLGFPINSPYDDYVYITDQFNHSASFVSTRNTPMDKVNIYKIRLQQDTTGIRFITVDEIRKASALIAAPPESFAKAAQEKGLNTPEVKPDSVVKPVLSGNYNKILAEALFLQIKADSAARITRDLRILAKETPNDSTKKQLISEILKNDKAAKYHQREADVKFAEAHSLRKMMGEDTGTVASTIIPDKEINGITVYKYRGQQSVNDVITQDEAVPENDTEAVPEEVESYSDKPVAAAKKDDFSILEFPIYSDSNPIPQGIKDLPGLIYRIQLGVFSNPKPNDAFGGITPISFVNPSGTSILKYYTGVFYSIGSVTRALEAVRSKGFKDAFIVAFLDGKLITTEKAREIEFADFNL